MSSTSSLAASAPSVEVMNVKRWHSRNNHARLLRASLRFGGEAALPGHRLHPWLPRGGRSKARGGRRRKSHARRGRGHGAQRRPRPRATPCDPVRACRASPCRLPQGPWERGRSEPSKTFEPMSTPAPAGVPRRKESRKGVRDGGRQGSGSGLEAGRRGGRGASQRRPRGRREAGRRRGTGCRGAVGS